MKHKKASHVGVVLSFVIFLVFLVFIYSILEPVIMIERDKQFILDYLKIKLVEETSTEMTTMSLSLNYTQDPGAYNCLNFSHAIGYELLNLVAKDKDNLPLGSSSSIDSLKVDWPDHDIEKFIKVYYSEEDFNDYPFTPGSCVTPRGENLSIGLIRTNEYIFETKINEFVNRYNVDYEKLKRDLKIPGEGDFSFSFTNVTEDVIGPIEKNISANIYVEEIGIQYIDKEANINSGFINIKVW